MTATAVGGIELASEGGQKSGLITADGVYPYLSEEHYHADPVPGGSLSSSGARLLLPPSCPALFRWAQVNGRKPRRVFDYGHAAHQRVLGVGAEIVVVQRTIKEKGKDDVLVDAEDYKTKSAQEHRDELRDAGKVPLLRAELERVEEMAAAIRDHELASVLFDPELGGQPEVSLFWTDPAFDVVRRARLDWLPPLTRDGRLIIPDYKTADCAERSVFLRSVVNNGYAIQRAWYTDVALALGLADAVSFVFVVQEKDPPYLVNVFELDDEWLRIGREDAARALGVYADCKARDVWPGYSSDDAVELLRPPGWLLRQYEELW